VDDHWTTDHTAPQETDHANNTNNVLLPDNITKHPSPTSDSGFASMSTVAPASTTAHLAAAVPKESVTDPGSSDLPGSFPITPAAENQAFSVAPIPATSGIGNPVQIQPGEAVPHPSSFTSNVVTSAVTHDKESYENGSSAPPQLPDVVTPQAERDAKGAGLFGLPEIGKGVIPESSLPVGGAEPVEKDPGVTIQSSAPQSTTAALAGQVPLEPHGVPEIVRESQAEAGFAPEASADPEAVREKSAVEQELESKVPEEPATSEGTSGGLSDRAAGASNVATKASAAVAGAASAAVGAAAHATNGKIGGSSAESNGPTAIAPTVPDVVQESIAESHQSPEAAASEEAVKEKSEVEAQLLQSVKTEESSGEPAPTVTASASETAPQALLKSTEEPLTGSTPAKSSDPGLAVPAAASASPPDTKQPARSRDVSPMTRSDGKSVAPTAVAESFSTPAKSATASSSTSTPASASESKKGKRLSGFFGKFKSKFGDKDKKPTA
jgi:hypothetical protein